MTERQLLLALLASAAVLRLLFAWDQIGIYWPDEIFQSLEPAHRLAFGFGMRAWEFIDGARNWTFPALIAVPMKLVSWLADSPEAYLRVLRLLFAELGVIAAWGTYRLARAHGAAPQFAAAGGALFALNAVSLYFSHRAMSETASLAPLVWGFVHLAEKRATLARVRLVLGASLLGLAVLFRLHNALFCLGAIALLLERRRLRDAALVLVVLGGWALLLGAIDKLTWGRWFASAIEYVRFNLMEGKGAAWGTAPFGYYARVAWSAMPGPAIVLLLTVPLSIRRAPALCVTCVVVFLQLSATPHKELRFAVTALPLLFALAAIGAETLVDLGGLARRRNLLALGTTVVSLHSMIEARQLTFGQLGAYETEKPRANAWRDSVSVNHLLLVAHRQADLCGLKVEATHLAWTGGQSYLHRRVNLYSHLGPPPEAGLYSHVISGLPEETGQVIAMHGTLALVRLPVSNCVPDPGYSDRLP